MRNQDSDLTTTQRLTVIESMAELVFKDPERAYRTTSDAEKPKDAELECVNH